MRPGSKADIFCSWTGITCDDGGNVVKVKLGPDTIGSGEKLLSGVLPDVEALLALPKLTFFAVYGQNLLGNTARQLWQIETPGGVVSHGKFSSRHTPDIMGGHGVSAGAGARW